MQKATIVSHDPLLELVQQLHRANASVRTTADAVDAIAVAVQTERKADGLLPTPEHAKYKTTKQSLADSADLERRRAAHGYDAADAIADAAIEQAHALEEQILSTAATTLPGLAAKFQYVFSVVCAHAGDKPFDDLNWGEKALVAFKRDLDRLAAADRSGRR